MGDDSIEVLTSATIRWEKTGDAEYPYRADVAGQRLLVGVNDFPAEPMYTLYSDGTALIDLDDWPPPWTRPKR